MALLGAEVIHVESARRPDGTRLIAGVPVTEEQWWEKQPIFAALNTNKKDITLDLATERGRELLTRLIATADVVAENYTPRVLDQLGLDHAAVQQINPSAIMLRMPGFGLDGPWRDNPAFAYVIEAAAGISWLTGYPDRNPYEPYSVGDPNAGLHALNGVLLALEHRRRTGEGVAGRGGDGRRRAQHRRRAGHRVHRLRRGAAARRQPRADRRAAEPLPHKRDRRVRPRRLLGGHRGGHRRPVGSAAQRTRRPALGRRSAAGHRRAGGGQART